jgi:cyclase
VADESGPGSPGATESFTRLGERSWVWLGDLARHEQTNVGIVEDEHSLIVVDANFGWAAERILVGIGDQFSLPVSHVANTHYHVDHSLGNEVFGRAGATVVGAAGQRAELLAKGAADAVIQVGRPPERFWPATLEFSGTITFGHSGLQLIALPPAHTASDLIAWLPDDSVLFVGDLAVAWEDGNNFSDEAADIDGWLRALEQCLALNPRIVVPAHGRIGGIEILERQHGFADALWRGARAAVESDQAELDAEVSRQLLADFGDYAVNPARLGEMAGSVIEAARRLRLSRGPARR